MSFDLFGPATKCDIRVGYIDPDLGYVKEVSIYDANEYAFKNPGTTFIFETRDAIRYLNINEVNNLTANDLLPKDNAAENTCKGIIGLSPRDSDTILSDGTVVPVQNRKGTYKTYVKLSGGGGTGAVANPVFGSDGSLLAINVIRGGFGYQYPPIVKIIDENKRGSGAVLRSVLGERPPTIEYFDQEDDFEFYDFSRCTEELEGYGTRFGVNGEVLGGWDPTLYATLAKDPIRVEIKEYQDYLAQGISPFWSTRKENPLAVTFRDRKTNLVFPVSDLKYKEKLRKEGKPVPSGWGPWMNTYAVSPVPPQWNSDVPGSDYAGGVATMTWEEEFPYDGVYTFKAMADNIAVIYIDNTPILETSNFIGGPTKRVDKNLKAGVHEIKIDLTNIPQLRKKKVNNKVQVESVGEEILVSYRGMSKGAGIRRDSNKLVRIDDNIGNGFDENARFQILESTCNARFSDDGKKILYSGSGDITIKYKYNDNPKNSGLAVTDIEAGGTVWERERIGARTGKKTYPITVAKRGSLGRGDNAAVKSVSKKTIKFTDSKRQNDTDAEFKILDSPGVTAEFRGSNDDNLELVVRGSGEVLLQLEWDDDPRSNGEAVGNIKVAGEVWKQRAFKNKKGDVKKTIKVSGGGGSSRGGSETYKEKGEVTKTISVKGSSKQNVSGTQKPTKVPENSSIVKQGFSGEVFNTVSAMGAANRRLWRTNVYGRGGFLGEYGVCPFDTKQNLTDNPYPGTHIITWPKVEIPADGNYDIEIEVDDRVKLTLANEVIEKNGFVGDSDKGTGKSTYTKFFRKGTYPLTAELYQKPGGRFSFQQGASVPTKSGGVSARFTRSGGDIFLVVEGSGSAKIDFSLRTSDTPSGGLALTEVSIGNANLKRTRSANIRSYHPDGRYQGKTGRELTGYSYKRKETITGSGTFTAGQRYKVVRKGAASSAPSPRLDGGSVFFNDSGNDSFDAELKLGRVHSPQPAAVKGVNPMALAVRISGKPDEYIISPVTWKENPMGVALTIDSPLPPIPEEPIPPQEGRCPNNPFWTTRFTGGKEKWWPVNVGPRWSDFMNRYAISPIAPRSERTTDGGGVPYFNTWNLDIPYNGYFGIKGTCDNFGSILIDGQEVYKLAGFKNPSPPIKKVYLSQGQHEISVKVENQKTTLYRQIEKTVFDTKDWGKPLANAPEEDVQFYTTSSAKFANSVELVGKFKVSKDYNGAQIKDTRTVKIAPGQVYDVIFRSNAGGGSPPKSRPGTRRFPIEIANPGSRGRGTNAAVKSVSKKTIKFTDSKSQDDTDAEFKILDSPGVTAEFKGSNDSNLELVVKGDGNVLLQLEWDDDTSKNGKAVGNLRVAGERFNQKGDKGDQKKTIKISGNTVTSGGGSGPQPNIRLRRKGENVVEMEEHKDNDYTDIIIRSNKGRFYGLNGNRAKFVLGSPAQNPTTPREINGVKYSGPDITKYTIPNWSSFMNMRGIAVYKPPRNEENPIDGVFNHVWSGVNIDATGRYAVRFQADVNANQTTQRTKFFINDTLIAEANSFIGDPTPTYVNLPEGKATLRVEQTSVSNPENIFDINPWGFGLQLTKVIDVPNGSKSWIQNPVGVSAILIPPPCPKTVEGKGVVTEIIVDEPGNGYPRTSGPGYPVILKLEKIIPTSPGIGYKPTDPIFIEGFPDVPIEIKTGPFGSVTEVIIPPPDGPATGEGTNRPLIGFTEYPNITLPSDTGIGFRGRPVFEPIIVPEDVFENVIQVTDLVGLKQTGYVNGKPYYGSVYSENGQLFAGIYATIGDPIPVYATLQESIDAEVVTRPSAILRQGTDVTNADPRLNIPGTPDNLV